MAVGWRWRWHTNLRNGLGLVSLDSHDAESCTNERRSGHPDPSTLWEIYHNADIPHCRCPDTRLDSFHFLIKRKGRDGLIYISINFIAVICKRFHKNACEVVTIPLTLKNQSRRAVPNIWNITWSWHTQQTLPRLFYFFVCTVLLNVFTCLNTPLLTWRLPPVLF